MEKTIGKYINAKCKVQWSILTFLFAFLVASVSLYAEFKLKLYDSHVIAYCIIYVLSLLVVLVQIFKFICSSQDMKKYKAEILKLKKEEARQEKIKAEKKKADDKLYADIKKFLVDNIDTFMPKECTNIAVKEIRIRTIIKFLFHSQISDVINGDYRDFFSNNNELIFRIYSNDKIFSKDNEEIGYIKQNDNNTDFGIYLWNLKVGYIKINLDVFTYFDENIGNLYTISKDSKILHAITRHNVIQKVKETFAGNFPEYVSSPIHTTIQYIAKNDKKEVVATFKDDNKIYSIYEPDSNPIGYIKVVNIDQVSNIYLYDENDKNRSYCIGYVTNLKDIYNNNRKYLGSFLPNYTVLFKYIQGKLSERDLFVLKIYYSFCLCGTSVKRDGSIVDADENKIAYIDNNYNIHNAKNKELIGKIEYPEKEFADYPIKLFYQNGEILLGSIHHNSCVSNYFGNIAGYYDLFFGYDCYYDDKFLTSVDDDKHESHNNGNEKSFLTSNKNSTSKQTSREEQKEDNSNKEKSLFELFNDAQVKVDEEGYIIDRNSILLGTIGRIDEYGNIYDLACINKLAWIQFNGKIWDENTGELLGYLYKDGDVQNCKGQYLGALGKDQKVLQIILY